jgi:uncharacterized protein YndB with AHSA1/START domain
MKFLKTLLIVVVIAIIGGLFYVIAQPSEYNVSRSKVIDVPVDLAFNAVNDLKTYEEWGPWHDEDSTIVVTYGSKTVGVGAEDSWTSAEGPGKMWITDVTPNQEIKQEMQFDDFDPNAMNWNFESVEGGTKVTWTMKDDNAPFLFKMASVYSGGWEEMFGPMQEKGLDNLDEMLTQQYIEETAYSIGEPNIVNLEGGTFAGYKIVSEIDNDVMTAAFQEYMPKAATKVMESGYTYSDFTPGAVMFNWDEDKNEAEMLIGVLLQNTDMLAESDLDTFVIEANKAVKLSKFGDYGIGDYEAHTEMDNYLKSNELTPLFPIFELYVNDPENVKKKDIQTDIYYPILN